jgi:hypothetical protein
MGKQQEQLEAMAAVMEGLASELRRLAVIIDEQGAGTKADPPPLPKKKKRREICVGDHVRVKVRGPYCNRTGVITSRRGLMYWNLRLDDPLNDRDPIIYKMGSSLELLDN